MNDRRGTGFCDFNTCPGRCLRTGHARDFPGHRICRRVLRAVPVQSRDAIVAVRGDSRGAE